METFIKNIALKDSVPVNQQKEPLFSSVTPVMSGLALKKELFTNTSERSLRVKIVNNRCYLREDAELKIFGNGCTRIGVLCIIGHCKGTFFSFPIVFSNMPVLYREQNFLASNKLSISG